MTPTGRKVRSVLPGLMRPVLQTIAADCYGKTLDELSTDEVNQAWTIVAAYCESMKFDGAKYRDFLKLEHRTPEGRVS